MRTVIHPQFHPLDPEWIEFAGDPAPRMHRVKRDGSGMECLYEHGNDEFIVHETFLGQTGDIVFTVWPHRLCRMDWTTREISVIAEHNCWHIAPNRAGTQVLFDTNHPDRGIQIVDVATGSHTRRLPVECQQRRLAVEDLALRTGSGLRSRTQRRSKASELDGSGNRHRIRAAVDAPASFVVARRNADRLRQRPDRHHAGLHRERLKHDVARMRNHGLQLMTGLLDQHELSMSRNGSAHLFR